MKKEKVIHYEFKESSSHITLHKSDNDEFKLLGINIKGENKLLVPFEMFLSNVKELKKTALGSFKHRLKKENRLYNVKIINKFNFIILECMDIVGLEKYFSKSVLIDKEFKEWFLREFFVMESKNLNNFSFNERDLSSEAEIEVEGVEFSEVESAEVEEVEFLNGSKEIVVINNVKVEFALVDEKIYTSSLQLAKVFEKRHSHILDIIKDKLNNDELANFNEPNFRLVEYKDQKGENRPMYHLTKDGFAFIAMSLTGRKADKFKVAYINSFNQLIELLQEKEQDKRFSYADKKATLEFYNQIIKDLKEEHEVEKVKLQAEIIEAKQETIEANQNLIETQKQIINTLQNEDFKEANDDLSYIFESKDEGRKFREVPLKYIISTKEQNHLKRVNELVKQAVEFSNGRINVKMMWQYLYKEFRKEFKITQKISPLLFQRSHEYMDFLEDRISEVIRKLLESEG